MNQLIPPKHLLVIDIDGLRQDVFHQALKEGQAPNLAGLLRGPGEEIHLNPVSTAPSITLCAHRARILGGARLREIRA